MNLRAGPTAIVTGGASGIGRALGAELARRGVAVVLADLDAAGAERAAAEIVRAGGSAKGVGLDVRDGALVEDLVGRVAQAAGRLDYMINNAGVSLVGEVRDMSAADWRRILSVNLDGVIHGSLAAYSVMVRQGRGHIVNMSSIAGLVPMPLSVAYNTTKHAVFGFSASLRAEAADLGVRVSVVCPGFIDTPLKDTMTYRNVDKAEALRKLPFRLRPVDWCARVIADGIERNDAVIVVSLPAKALWWLYRLSPGFFQAAARLTMRRARSLRGDGT